MFPVFGHFAVFIEHLKKAWIILHSSPCAFDTSKSLRVCAALYKTMALMGLDDPIGPCERPAEPGMSSKSGSSNTEPSSAPAICRI